LKVFIFAKGTLLVVEFCHLARIEAPAKPCKNNQESVSADRDDGGGVGGGGGGAASGEGGFGKEKDKGLVGF